VQRLHHYATLIVAIIFSLLVINLTDFVVKPAKASYEGGAHDRRTGAARARGGNPARHRRDFRSLAGLGIDGIRDAQATTQLIDRLIEGRPMVEVAVVDADKGVIARAIAPDTEGIKDPVPPAQSLWQAVNPGAAGPDRIADRRVLRDASSSSASRSSW